MAFATQVKRRRGTTAQNDAFTGAEGEIVVDTQKHALRVHDGQTQGGFEIATRQELESYIGEQLATKADADLGNIPANYDYVVESQLPTAENGYTWYRKYKSGWVEQGGTMSYANAEQIKTIVLPIEMANSNYTLQLTRKDGSAASADTGYRMQQYNSKTTTGFSFWWSINDRQSGIDWQVSGISAE